MLYFADLFSVDRARDNHLISLGIGRGHNDVNSLCNRYLLMGLTIMPDPNKLFVRDTEMDAYYCALPAALEFSQPLMGNVIILQDGHAIDASLSLNTDALNGFDILFWRQMH